MALTRIGTSCVFNTVTRVSHAACLDIQCTGPMSSAHRTQCAEPLHATCVRRYPDPPTLRLPVNVCDIFANETGRFTSERSRDIALYSENIGPVAFHASRYGFPRIDDSRVDSYDCFGAVSLNGTMQSNVPKPFSSRGKSTHLNMPGGQWARDGKYIAEDMQKSHYQKLRSQSCVASNILVTATHLRTTHTTAMGYSTNASKGAVKKRASWSSWSPSYVAMSKKEKFRIMLRDYGGTLLGFHISISLISLGCCYLVVISGVDVTPLATHLTGGNETLMGVMKTSTDFILAYTVHKLLAPFRISLTLSVTPFLVSRLRRIGFLKLPKAKPSSSSSSPPSSPSPSSP